MGDSRKPPDVDALLEALPLLLRAFASLGPSGNGYKRPHSIPFLRDPVPRQIDRDTASGPWE